jgi:hypothetical protein
MADLLFFPEEYSYTSAVALALRDCRLAKPTRFALRLERDNLAGAILRALQVYLCHFGDKS